MPTALTPVVERTAIVKPVGSDVFSLAAVTGMAQSIANRGEWNSKSLIDVKSLLGTTADTDYNNATFATMVDGELTFTSVSIGDKILLYSDTTWHQSGAMTADGTDPTVNLRWLVGGATDLSVVSALYPGIVWGHTIPASASDYRGVSVSAVHTAVADAASLTAALQSKHSNGTQVCTHSQLIGVHFRLGAA